MLEFLKTVVKISQSFRSICSKTSQLFVLESFLWFVTEIPLAVNLACSPLSYLTGYEEQHNSSLFIAILCVFESSSSFP